MRAVWLPVLLVIGVAGTFCVVSLALAVLSGWRDLAGTYRASLAPHGRSFTCQWADVGSVHYNASLGIVSSPDGVFLSAPLLFHPLLFIPAEDLHPTGARRLLWLEQVELQVGSPSIARLWLPKAPLEVCALDSGEIAS